MPGENVQDWSTTAANNATADSSINWAEGMARAAVNNSARSMMAGTAKWRDLLNGSITTGGSANAQTFSSGLSYTSVPTGPCVRLKLGFTNTASASLNMDSIGAVTIKDGSGVNLQAGDLIANDYADFRYDGTNWILLSVTKWWKDNNATLTTGGTAGVQTVTTNAAYGALATGLRLALKAGFTNTGAVTLNVTPSSGGVALGAKAIKIFDASVGEADPAAGQIKVNGLYHFIYDTGANASAGAWILTNPSYIG